MKTCKDTTELVTAYIERQLPLMTRLGIWLHIQMCEPCRRYFKQIERVAGATGELPPLEMPPEVAASMNTLFERASAEWTELEDLEEVEVP
ncbi:MAG: putative anti-sigma-YlaC factor YlaD [Myxococcota bacterium]|jgi:predicted anti-sigma-YlaC factor YlaD